MTYEESVRYLLTLGRELASPQHARAVKFGLENITRLAARQGEPQRACRSAHIAGTNGKGSTAAMLDSVLRAAGLRTGLYTSPHLERINERIRLDGTEISDADFAAAFTRLHAVIEEMLASGQLASHPTYFECLTSMAFEFFARARVDFAVFEVGLGGRLDATNILEPEVAVITQIDFDHENYLGHSIEEIAGEKAGIIKPGASVVSAAAHPKAREVIVRRCAEQAARLVEVDSAYREEDFSAREDGSEFTAVPVDSGARLRIAVPLPGRYQARNALTALAAARVLAGRGVALDDAAIARGIAATRWPGRLERISERPAIYLDGTHNPAGARELSAFWDEHFAGRRIVLVYGAVRDKAVDEVAGLLFPRADAVILTAARQPRSISAHALGEMLSHHAARFETIADSEAALERAIELALTDAIIFATGSLYLVGELRNYWFARRAKLPQDRILRA